MKLPILLFVLVAFGHAASLDLATKDLEVTKLVAKPKANNQTNKRELYEGNFGERNRELITKYVNTKPAPKIEYAQEIKEAIPVQSPDHQIFGVRLPQISKISDVLSEQGSYEAAVAKHLYSPISVYHVRPSPPTSFEVPTPAASQLVFPAPKSFKLFKASGSEQKQEVPQKQINSNLKEIPLYAVQQPRLRFESFPQPLNSLAHQHRNLPQEYFRAQQIPREQMSPLFPIYDQLGPIRYQGQVVPSEYLHQNKIYKLLPVNPDGAYSIQEADYIKDYSIQDSSEEVKPRATEKPKAQVQSQIPGPQGYHAHPNGAISFASFSQSAPFDAQQKTGPQPPKQSGKNQESQPVGLPTQPKPEVAVQLQYQPEVTQFQYQDQILGPMGQKLSQPPIYQELVPNLPNQPEPDLQSQPQFIAFKQQFQNPPRVLNALQQHLLYQNPRQLVHPRVIPYRIPPFKPIPQSQLDILPYYQEPSSLQATPEPRKHETQSTQRPSDIDKVSVSPQKHYTPLPPLKANYSQHVKPLKPQTVFLPTLSTPTPKEKFAQDQVISSTTIKPEVKFYEEPKEESTQTEAHTPPQTSETPEPVISYQPRPTAPPLSIQPTTYRPFAIHEAQSEYFRSTPQPAYQSTTSPHSVQTPPRHDVVIQQQEIQELIFDPFPQPSSTPLYQQQSSQNPNQLDQDIQQLQSHEHDQLFEQLQPLHFQHELQELRSQQYQLNAPQSDYPNRLYPTSQLDSQQYHIQQILHPLQPQQLQPIQLQGELLREQQSQQQQQESEQTQLQQQNNQNQVATTTPLQELEKQIKPESQHQMQLESRLQPSTGNNEQPDSSTEISLNSEQPRHGPALSPIQAVLSQLLAQPQQVVTQSDYTYPDVQYFGKFAEALFGKSPSTA